MTYEEVLPGRWQVVINTPEDLREFLHSTNELVVVSDTDPGGARDEMDDLMDMF